MKRWVKALSVVVIMLSVIVLCLMIFWQIQREEYYKYKGRFNPTLNKVVQTIFEEVVSEENVISFAGYPGEDHLVYPGGRCVSFVVYSERANFTGGLHAHFPRRYAETEEKDEGELILDNGSVIEVCFSLHNSGEPFSKGDTTYRLGENDSFDRAFLGFMKVYDESFKSGGDWGKWESWGDAYNILGEARDSLVEHNSIKIEQVAPSKTDSRAG